MKTLRSVCMVVLLAMSLSAWSADGLIAVKSPFSPKETMDRLETLLQRKGLTIFARVDHAAGAKKVGKTLRPTELLIFGNPQGGTPFMECAQTVGIDLPLKALVWEDATGQVWLGYNDPAFLAARHGVPECSVVAKLQKALAGFAQETVAD
ncbi:MAG: DUF302 domain-containing protein [Candidatus Competibacteraceae bacterium]|nr:DUF302 domain-containing protein [Candidatus Competibacteraceae bacterium]